MYIPPGLTFLRLLQFPLSLVGFDRLTSQPAEVNEDLNHLGNLSPYHDVPTGHGISADLPGDCTVDQVILLHRHGSRGPSSKEAVFIQKLASTLKAASKVIQEAHLPPELEFLKEGYEYHLVPDNLTIIGHQQLFDHGVEFSLRYPKFSTDYVISTTVPRVIESAHYFAQGFFGLDVVDKVKFFTTADCGIECRDPVSWLLGYMFCPKIPTKQSLEISQKWADKYMPPIMDRLNKLIPGVNFKQDDIQGALYACPYDLAARGKSPWCNVFTASELSDFDYQLDLDLDGNTGHAITDPGKLAGASYVNKTVERLTNSTGTAKSLYLDFAHDLTILYALSTMGLNKDKDPLPSDHVVSNRKFRSSDEAPFAARMIWERFTCKTSFQGPQVRLLLNGATYPLTSCKKSDDDSKYGTCSVAEFKKANQWSLSPDVKYNTTYWNNTCGQPSQH